MKTKEEQIRAAAEAARRSADSDIAVKKALAEAEKDKAMFNAVLQIRRMKRDERERRSRE